MQLCSTGGSLFEIGFSNSETSLARRSAWRDKSTSSPPSVTTSLLGTRRSHRNERRVKGLLIPLIVAGHAMYQRCQIIELLTFTFYLVTRSLVAGAISLIICTNLDAATDPDVQKLFIVFPLKFQ